MSLELYWGSGSTPAWRVQLALAIKDVPYHSHLLQFSQRETHTPAFLALNPRGKVPTLVHHGHAINESIAILAYLERAFPEHPLFGETPAETGQVWRFVMEHESHAATPIATVTRPLLYGDHVHPPDPAAVALVHAELTLLEQRVSTGYLVGRRISAADIVWFCALQLLVRADTRPMAARGGVDVWPLGVRWPGLLPWAQNIENIPGYDATFPPHWRDGAHPSPARLE